MIIKNIAIIHENKIQKNTDIRLNEKTGCIQDINSKLEPESKEKILNGSGLWIFPGLIDIHVHLRDFEQNYKEDYKTGVKSAISGGYTTIFDMPNKVPPVDTYEIYKIVLNKIENIKDVDIYQYVMITNDLLKKNDFWTYGKIYLGAGSTSALGQEYSILDKTNKFKGKFISIHAEDSEIIAKNSKIYKNPVFDHNKIRSPDAETIAIKNVLEKIKNNNLTKNHIHFAHVSLPSSIELINSYKLENISFEAAPHHLFLNEDDLIQLGSFGKVNPPLRSYEDMHKLRILWEEGKIPVLASDHAPHTEEEKKSENPSGIPSLDTNFRVLLDHCLRNSISPSLITKTYSTNPAKLIGLFKDHGSIETGKKADFVLVDPTKEEKITKSMLNTKAKFSPWENKILKGVPLFTFKAGTQVWNNPKHFDIEHQNEFYRM